MTVGNAVDIGAYEFGAVTPTSNLSVTTTASNLVVPGGYVSYLITVTNEGTSPVSNVTIRDNVPSESTSLTFTKISGPKGGQISNTGNGTVTGWDITLNPKESVKYNVVVQVPTDMANGTVLTNNVSVGPVLDVTNPDNNVSFNTTVTTSAETSVSINAPATITYGSNAVVTLTASSLAGTPTGNITLTVDNGSPITQALDNNGTSTFTLTGLTAAHHGLSASYAAQGNFAASSTTGVLILNVNQATPTLSVTDAGGTYNGQPFPATVTVAGVDGTPATSLEGVTPTLTYYAGNSTNGTALSGAPTQAGTYTVLASFAGSTDYTPASISTTFTIAQATPTVSVSNAGGIFNGQPFAATATVTDVSGNAGSTLEGVSLVYDYQQLDSNGKVIADLGSIAPMHAGSYQVTASFAGSTDYAAANAGTKFTIAQVTPTIRVTDTGGTYNGQPFPATATVAGVVVGVDNNPSASLEGVPPTLTYYAGQSASGTALPGTPGNAGTYTVVASFPGSTDYTPVSTRTTFTISPALLTATGAQVSATAGAPFSGTVATFTNADPLGDAASYTATITWGDGSTSNGVISGSGRTLTVSGSHTYAAPDNETIWVTISHKLGDTTTAMVSDGATVRSSGMIVQTNQMADISFWHSSKGQALIDSFNGGSTATGLATWLATTFPNLYGAGAGVNNLTGMTNAQVAAFYQSQLKPYTLNLEAQVLALALNVYATTLSLGGNVGQAYGFKVSANGLGADLLNVLWGGSAFGVPNFTTLNVYQLLLAVNAQTIKGVLYNGNPILQWEASFLFDLLDLMEQ